MTGEHYRTLDRNATIRPLAASITAWRGRGAKQKKADALKGICLYGIMGWMMGLEPTASWATTKCSNQLSYIHHISCTVKVGLLYTRSCSTLQQDFSCQFPAENIPGESIFDKGTRALSEVSKVPFCSAGTFLPGP